MPNTDPNLLDPVAPLKDTRSWYRRPWFISLVIIAVLWFGLPLLLKLFVPVQTSSGFTPLKGAPAAPAVAVTRVETSDDPVSGFTAAPITIVEFGDFQCPYCRQAAPIMKELLRRYPEAVRLQYRDFPLSDVHPQAVAAAEAAQCAHLQGKFWQYHDALFAAGEELPEALFTSIAQSLSLDMEAFAACRESHQTLPGVRRDFEAGVAAGVQGTPTWFVNGRRIEGTLPIEVWDEVVLAVLQATLTP